MEPTLRLPEKVKQDTVGYRAQVERFLEGDFSPMAFRAYRVPMGVYEQRKVGTYMVRIRIGAGTVSSLQLDTVARLSRQYGNGLVHVTTRQDLQVHEVPIESTPDVLEGLLEAGLSSRGGGGNTVRNVTACSRAGVCPRERFDVAPYTLAVAEYLLQFDSSYNLPRKYKIAFSGCPSDCALASVADLGFFAHLKEGVRGFSAYAGGGLGPNPAIGVKIEDFVRDDEVFEVAEAVKRLFDKYGDRANKHRARLRYVVERLGAAEFVRCYQEERARIRQDGLGCDVPKVTSRTQREEDGPLESSAQESPTSDVRPEKRDGFYTLRVRLPLGDISADDLSKVARIAKCYGIGTVRTTQQQDLLIPSVSQAHLEAVRREVQDLSFDASGGGTPKVVACAGAATCKLGLCLSRGLAKAIAKELAAKPVTETSAAAIRISGCPNSCGQHHVGQIGLQGRALRVGGRLMPCYDILVGAQTIEGQTRLAEKIGTVPAKRVPQMVAELLDYDRSDTDLLRQVVRKYSDLAAQNVPDDYYYDWGQDRSFSLAGRGPGECGVGVMDLIKVDIEQAKESLKTSSQTDPDDRQSQSLYQTVQAAARSLLVIFGVEPKTDREIFDAFRKHVIEFGWVKAETGTLLDEAIDWRMGARATIADRWDAIAALLERVEELFLSLDAGLKFTVAAIRSDEQSPAPDGPSHKVDLRGVPCPLNFVKTKLAIEKIAIGQVVEIALDEGEPIRNVPASVTGQGQEVVETLKVDDYFLLRIRRVK